MQVLPGILTGSFTESGVKLFAVRQLGDQAMVRVAIGGQEECLSIPGRRAGSIFTYIEGKAGESYRLSVERRFLDTCAAHYQIEEVPLTSAEDLLAASSLHSAEIAWHLGSKDEIARAFELFSIVEESNTSIQSLRDHANYYRGLIAYQQFRFEDARSIFALLSKDWWQDHEYHIASLWALGAIALEQYETAESQQYLKLALSESKAAEAELPWIQFDQVEIKLFLALANMRMGESQNGLMELEEGFHIAETLRSRVLEGKLRNNYAAYFEHYIPDVLDNYIENFDQARTQYEKGLSLLDEAGEIVTRTSTLANLGRLAIVAGELAEAQIYYQRALSLNSASHNEVLRGYLYSQLGSLYLKLGEVSRAKHYLLHSFQNRAMAKAKKVAIQDQIQLGKIARLEARPDIALEYLVPLIEDLDVREEIHLVTPAYIEASRTYLELNQINQALECSKAIYALRNGLELPSVYSEVSRVHIDSLIKTGNTEAAETALETLLLYSNKQAYSLETIQVLSLATYFFGSTDIQKAIKYGESACEVADKLRGQLDLARLGPSFANQTGSLHQTLARLYFKRAHMESNEALLGYGVGVLEKGKAAVLAAQRSRSSQKLESQKLREAKKRVNVLTSKRMSSVALAEDLELTNAYYEALEELSSELASSSVEITTFDVDRFVRQLPERHLVLEFILQDDSLGVVMMSKSMIEYQEVDEPLTLNDLTTYFEDVKKANPDTFLSATRVFPTQVLEKVLVSEVVTIVPAGPLHHLPFASLTLDFKDRKLRLNEVVSVIYAHSLNSLVTESTPTEASSMCILADPAFQAPSDNQQDEYQAEAFRNWSAKLERLPWTAKEAAYIQNAFPKINCTLFEGTAATKQNLCSSDTRQASILHIASHGYFSSKLDDIAGIALAEVPGQQESSFLAITDLFDLNFSNQLVVISGCETGMGRSVEGEGLMSVSRGFLSQGAETVVSTLWPVSDRASALFMKYFYQYLAESESPVVALQQSQRALRETPRYSAPFYWATYIIHSSNLTPRITFSGQI
jgi:CHAT domain-containing protein